MRFVCLAVCPLYRDALCTRVEDTLLYGHGVECLSEAGDVFFVETEHGSRGFLPRGSLSEGVEGTLTVCRRGGEVTSAPRPDSPRLLYLPRFARVSVISESAECSRVRLLDGRTGYLPRVCLQSPPAPSVREGALDTALSLLGVVYRLGGRSEQGVDCSGLVCLSYSSVGVFLPRNCAEMRALAAVDTAHRGDLVLFEGHVGLLLTPTRFVHAASVPGYVSIASLLPSDPLYDARHAEGGYTFRRPLP